MYENGLYDTLVIKQLTVHSWLEQANASGRGVHRRTKGALLLALPRVRYALLFLYESSATDGYWNLDSHHWILSRLNFKSEIRHTSQATANCHKTVLLRNNNHKNHGCQDNRIPKGQGVYRSI